MTEQQPAQSGQDAAASPGAQTAPSPPPSGPLPPDRKAQAFAGGMLAGIGIAIGLAIVMHVIQQASPIGPEINTSASVALVLLVVGPIIGLGLGLGLAATASDFRAVSPEPPAAAPTDQPPLPSA